MANEATPMATSQVNPWLAAGQMAISAGNGLFGYLGQKKQMAQAERMATEQRNWNAMLMNAQANWDLEQWNRTNEYNSPVEQVNRLREAGLNPLYYGLDGTSANAFQASQPLGYDRASIEQMQNPFAAGLNAATQSAQALNLQKELEVKQAQIDNLNQNTAKQGEETLTETERRQNMVLERDKMHTEIDNLVKSGKLTDKEIEKAQKDLDWYDRLTEAEIGYKESVSKLNDSQRNRIDELLPGEKELQQMSIEDFYHRWDEIQASINKMAAETGLIQEDIENYALNHMSNGILGSGLSVQNAVRNKLQGWKEKRNLKNAEKGQNDRLKNATQGM